MPVEMQCMTITMEEEHTCQCPSFRCSWWKFAIVIITIVIVIAGIIYIATIMNQAQTEDDAMMSTSTIATTTTATTQKTVPNDCRNEIQNPL